MSTEPNPGRDLAHASANPMKAVAYIVAVNARLATVASTGGEHGEYICIPASYEEAMRSPEAQQWQEAKENEDSLLQHDVYRLIPESEVPVNQRVMCTQYLYKVKPKRTFKARLVVQNYQRSGMDYTVETLLH